LGKLPGILVGPYSDVYGFGRTCYFALLGTPLPDDGERAALPTPWQRLLSECTARAVAHRLPDFAAVLARLAQLPAWLHVQRTTQRISHGGHPLLPHRRAVRRVLQLRPLPDPAARQDLADQRALLPGAEVRRHAARGGDPPGRLANDRRPP